MLQQTPLSALLNNLRKISRSEHDKGRLFEKLIAAWLKSDPQYSDIEEVWLWNEWPDRWEDTDTGIDLVALTKAGEYWAIQCKFFDPDHTVHKSDIDSFFTASGKKFTTADGQQHSFARRLIVSTTDKWARNAEEALVEQVIPVSRISLYDLEQSPVDWEQLSPVDLEKITRLERKPRKVLRDHQKEALEKVLAGFQEHDRGKLIMACGTGKTFTSLKIAEEILKDRPDGVVVFFAPSISLVSQTLREWTAEAETPFHAFVVCSDSKVGRDEEDITTHDLAYPATTDASKLAQAIDFYRNLPEKRPCVIFSTYQSIDVVIETQRKGLGEIDLIICDEAHRTTGITLQGQDDSIFTKVHDNSNLRASKRLYMTATPRIYTEASKSKAKQKEAVLYSMDDEGTFGPEFYRLSFGKAVTLDLLSDYKVLIVAVEEELMDLLANAYNAWLISEDGERPKGISTDFAVKVIGSWKGLSKKGILELGDEGQQEAKDAGRPMQRAVAFAKTIKQSKELTEAFSALVDRYQEEHLPDDGRPLVRCEVRHVDGSMNAMIRNEMLDWLRQQPEEGTCRILSNARCLSEGIDVPALDSVIFFDTRESIVDIVQSVGRVMRKAPGKEYGYIILPVGIPREVLTDLAALNRYIESDDRFKGVWKVIKALRAHDESLVDEAEFRNKVQLDIIKGNDGDKSGDAATDDPEAPELPLPIPVDDIANAVYAVLPKKLGDREYWADWAKDVARIAERVEKRIRTLIEKPEAQEAFQAFLRGLQGSINPSISEEDAIDMLVQHVITRPIFEALFEGTGFLERNPVSKSLQAVIDVLDAHAIDAETESLKPFYDYTRERIALARSDKSRQEVIRNLYDTFFRNAFPRMAERLGIVYTPVEVVDFIIRSADAALRKHLGSSLTERNVQILDPFTGTGTFIVRLLQSGLIREEDLPHKYRHELHANEIVLLAYYIATVNIEAAYHALTDRHEPFEGIVLTDTFQMTEIAKREESDIGIGGFSDENSERAKRQLAQDIRVIVGNPPYSVGQKSENDNNPNLDYPNLDQRIDETYAAKSPAKLRTSLKDSYIRAIRWASDRIGDQGIVAYVTNGSFIDGNAAAGLRACLTEEFSHLYVFNLRGNQRTSGELSRQEGGKIFGSGSRTPVAITIMVKNLAHEGECELLYHDIGDYLSREEKLRIIEKFASIENVPWQPITPNEDNDWINQRDPAFDDFLPLNDEGSKSRNVFSIRSSGVKTNRDAWVYNFSRESLVESVKGMIGFYNAEVDSYMNTYGDTPPKDRPDPKGLVNYDDKKFKWDGSLYPYVKKGMKGSFNEEGIRVSVYRPFVKEWMYFDRMFNNSIYQIPKLFPTPQHKNMVIAITGRGASKPFSAYATNTIPNLHLMDTGQCFPLYWYQKVEDGSLAAHDGEADAHGYIRHDAITDWALKTFRKHYEDENISREDIFWYAYGVLSSPEYRQRFQNNLKKELARLPLAQDFWAFSKAGRALGELHLNYENLEPWPLKEEHLKTPDLFDGDEYAFYHVQKMRFAGKRSSDKSTIIYNDWIILKDIPEEAHVWQVNGRTPLEWALERYQVKTDKASGITNDPNDWCREHNQPRYIIDLLKRLVRLSVETTRIISGMPKL